MGKEKRRNPAKGVARASFTEGEEGGGLWTSFGPEDRGVFDLDGRESGRAGAVLERRAERGGASEQGANEQVGGLWRNLQ
jgi:hypothetical protein